MPPPVHFPAVPDSVGLQPNNGATNIRATDGMAAATLINRFISSPYIHGKLLSFAIAYHFDRGASGCAVAGLGAGAP